MRRFTSFLDADNGRGTQSTRIQEMVQVPLEQSGEPTKASKRLIISLNDLRDFDSSLCDDVLMRPVEHLPVLERAVQDLISGFRQELAENRRQLSDYRIGFNGAFGSRFVSPRGLSARLIGGIVCVQGIVTRASTIRPRLVLSVHYCPRTGKFLEKTYRDNASVSSLAAFTQNAGMGSAYPTQDEDGNPLETEYGKCWYRDSQRITIQEMPESSPPGQLPRSTEVLIEGDLCDACKPGDRVHISGIFRAIGGAVSTGGNGIFKTFVVANHITLAGGSGGDVQHADAVHERDVGNIIEYGRKKDVFARMARSIAPSICGHDYIKKALLLLLIGGKEQNLENGTHLRGDINVMMVGDPSTAKSQLLRFILNTAPLAVSTTGRGSSGVGLTAAVTTDQDTGDRHLEAGAMVLADRGVVCIDEFDKMSDEDRVAIHEVMEQQTVTIAKAGIHASLNARCSVIAAANPVYGSYDKKRKPHENIALPDSLLSRFDLLFIVLDSANKERDRQIAEHVLRGHRFRKATDTLDENDEGDIAGHAEREEARDEPVPMYENAASALYRAQAQRASRRQSARNKKRGGKDDDDDRILSMKFLKLYINYAKHRAHPTLTPAAAENIAAAYRDLRQDVDTTKTLPITARCLETLIRLATAHAKCRLDKTSVTVDDVAVAVSVLKFALFNQAEPDKPERELKRAVRPKLGARGDATDDDDSDSDGDDAPTTTRASRRAARSERDSEAREAPAGAGTTPEKKAEKKEATPGRPEADNLQASAGTEASEPNLDKPSEGSSDDNVVARAKIGLNELRGRDDVLPLATLAAWLKKEKFSEEQIRGAVEKLQSDDIIVVSDDTVFIV